jgi:translocon-associated protein subunit beta
MRSPMKLAWGLMALLVLSSAACVRAEDDVVDIDDEYEDVVRAHLIVRKSVESDIAVAGRNITITLDIYNTGSGWVAPDCVHAVGVRV